MYATDEPFPSRCSTKYRELNQPVLRSCEILSCPTRRFKEKKKTIEGNSCMHHPSTPYETGALPSRCSISQRHAIANPNALQYQTHHTNRENSNTNAISMLAVPVKFVRDGNLGEGRSLDSAEAAVVGSCVFLLHRTIKHGTKPEVKR